jgi:hypothetical protein
MLRVSPANDFSHIMITPSGGWLGSSKIVSRNQTFKMKMSKLKRSSENQLSKDIYEAEEEEEDARFKVQPDPGQGMTRASEDVMQRRKIIKVSR